MAQVQCPNCGGYRVVTEKTDSITEAYELVHPYSPAAYALAMFVYFICTLAFLAAAAIGIIDVIYSYMTNLRNATVIGDSESGVSWIILVIAIGCGVIGIILVREAIDVSRKFQRTRQEGVYRTRRFVKIGEIYHYYCQLCGKRWRSDEPQPETTVKPDLIAAGSQRLEEEAEKRRRDAEAAWWYQQQQKKK